MKYRADVDGLRTVAVMSVLLYHVGFSWIDGGFLGVDIFFVISGFLITNIIVKEVETKNSLDFGRFYSRRVRRLFPTLATVTLLTTIAAVFILPDDLLQKYGGSAIHAILSLSNIFFWSESGYFDVGSGLKPLLHTWSLSVEEQFYFIWPALLLFTVKYGNKALALGVVIFLAVLTYVAGEFILMGGAKQFAETAPGFAQFFAEPESSTFFLTPFRIFEFACGAVLVWLGSGSKGNAVVHNALSVLGLIGIGYGFFMVTEESHFPSYNALIPCVGAALIIASPKSLFAKYFLSLKPVVWIGQISYTLYLVHWPIMVFYKYLFPVRDSDIDRIVLLALCFLLSIAIYYLIESPLRRPRNQEKALSQAAYALASVGVAVALIFPLIHIYKGNIKSLAKHGFDYDAAETIAKKELDSQVCFLSEGMDTNPACNSKAPVQVLTIGNSHELHGYRVLRTAFKAEQARGEVNFVFASTHARDNPCQFETFDPMLPLQTSNEKCRWIADYLSDEQAVADRFDTVIVAAFRPARVNKGLYLTMAQRYQAKNPDLKVGVIGSFVDIQPHRCMDLANAAQDANACADPSLVNYFGINEQAEDQAFVPDLKFTFVNQTELLCSGDGYETCETTYLGVPILRDSNHFNNVGTAFIAKKLKESPQKAELKKLLTD